MNNKYKRIIVTSVICVLLLISVFFGYHGFVGVSANSPEKLTAAAEGYFETDGLKLLKTEKRGNYLAVLFRDKNEKAVLGVFERDSVFQNRYEVSGGTIDIESGKIESWNCGNEKGEAVLVFGGIGIPDHVKSYAFTNSGKKYTCPVDSENVLNLFVIPDAEDINGAPEQITE
ncbi:MAG: hypothetical protein ACI4XE_11925 [Acutalibacteraceae bacterium]